MGDIMYAKLRDIRRRSGVTCEMMAKILGLKTRSGYSKKETGAIPFTLEEAQVISKYFSMPIESVFSDEDTLR